MTGTSFAFNKLGCVPTYVKSRVNIFLKRLGHRVPLYFNVPGKMLKGVYHKILTMVPVPTFFPMLPTMLARPPPRFEPEVAAASTL